MSFIQKFRPFIENMFWIHAQLAIKLHFKTKLYICDKLQYFEETVKPGKNLLLPKSLNCGRDPLSQNFRLEFSKISLSIGTVLISTRSRTMPARATFSAKIQNGGYAIVLVCFRV